MTNAETTDTTPMNAAKLQGMIVKYRHDASARDAAVAAMVRKPARRRTAPLTPPTSGADLDAQWGAIYAEIDRLYKVVDNVYPQKMFETFLVASEEIVKQARGMFIENLADGADGPGVQVIATLFRKYNQSMTEMVAFAEERKAKELSPFATMAALAGIGSMLMMNYFRKQP